MDAFLTGQQGEGEGHASFGLGERRRTQGEHGQHGDKADAVLLREFVRRLFQKHLRDRIRLPCKLRT